MQYQFAPDNQRLNRAYHLRAELRTLQAGEKDFLKQVVLSIRYRWHEALSGQKNKLPR